MIAQIESAYEMLDQKANEYEDNVFEFLDGLMAVAGLDDTPTLTRSKISNIGEQISNVLQASDHLTDDYVTKKILTLLGDGDLADDIIKEKDAENMQKINVESDDGQSAPDNRRDNQEDGEPAES